MFGLIVIEVPNFGCWKKAVWYWKKSEHEFRFLENDWHEISWLRLEITENVEKHMNNVKLKQKWYQRLEIIENQFFLYDEKLFFLKKKISNRKVFKNTLSKSEKEFIRALKIQIVIVEISILSEQF